MESTCQLSTVCCYISLHFNAHLKCGPNVDFNWAKLEVGSGHRSWKLGKARVRAPGGLPRWPTHSGEAGESGLHFVWIEIHPTIQEAPQILPDPAIRSFIVSTEGFTLHAVGFKSCPLPLVCSMTPSVTRNGTPAVAQKGLTLEVKGETTLHGHNCARATKPFGKTRSQKAR